MTRLYRASRALPEYRAQLEANPEALHLPLEQIQCGQVVVAEGVDRVAGFAVIVVGPDSAELEGLFDEIRLPYANATLRALRETLAIEGARGLVLRCVAAVPDTAWRHLMRVMPTLIYRFGEGAEDFAFARGEAKDVP